VGVTTPSLISGVTSDDGVGRGEGIDLVDFADNFLANFGMKPPLVLVDVELAAAGVVPAGETVDVETSSVSGTIVVADDTGRGGEAVTE